MDKCNQIYNLVLPLFWDAEFYFPKHVLRTYGQCKCCIIVTIWSVQPLGGSVLDYFIYGEKLRKHHLVGMVLVIASGLCISFPVKSHNDLEIKNSTIFAGY